jgi:hypothetical protein
MTDRDRLLGDALKATRVGGDEGAAEERAWRVVAAASAAGIGAPARRRRHRRRALQIAAVAALIVLVVSPAGASVRHWVADRIEPGAPHAKPVLSSLPENGSLLVDSAQGPWVVRPDGAKRLLGDWSEASWSPHGLFAVVTQGHELAAVEPDGTVRWALTRPGAVGLARWNGPDGYRIAYLAGDRLRVVDGDGTDDRGLARGVAPVAPAWRAGPTHVLAYATDRGAVVAVRADSGRRVFATAPAGPVASLQWGADALLVTRPGRLQLLKFHGRPLWSWTPPPGTRVAAATAAPGARRIAAVVRDGRNSRLLLVTRGRGTRVLFAGPGVFAAPRWSPDGRWLLLPWRSADQWLFLNPGSGTAKLHAVANVAKQFSPGDAAGAPFPSVAGWSR